MGWGHTLASAFPRRLSTSSSERWPLNSLTSLLVSSARCAQPHLSPEPVLLVKGTFR